MQNSPFEVLIIGGGPAGLSAAVYSARYNRSTAVFDTGHGRSTWHQINHNYLVFPGGVPARRLRELAHEQLAEYAHVAVFNHKIERIRYENGCFIVEGQAGTWQGSAVILATGVLDHYPHFDGWASYVGRSLFWCITCDGYGCQGCPVVVTGATDGAASLALQLQRFTDTITLLTDSHTHTISAKFMARLERAQIPVIVDKIATAEGADGQFEALTTIGNQRIELARMFSFQGQTPQSDLARQLGVRCTETGYIVVDTEQKTNLAGVYAAGDVTRLHSHQITTAVHEGGQAADAANYFLYPPDLKDE